MIEIRSAQPASDAAQVGRLRIATDDGAETTAHVARYPRQTVGARVVRLDPPEEVAHWCARLGITDAISGGFFAKPHRVPLGALRVEGAAMESQPFRAPWNEVRGCLGLRNGTGVIAPYNAFSVSEWDHVLQAGPILVQAGELVVAHTDPEGFSSTCDEFDQDFTSERLPRMAVGISRTEWLAISVDGRSPDDAGLLLPELADLLIQLGAISALNLDGGSSSALVAAGTLRNQPRDDDQNLLPDGCPTTTAVVFA